MGEPINETARPVAFPGMCMKGELMTDWLLLLLRDLCFTIWLGGLIAIDCIEAPARFRNERETLSGSHAAERVVTRGASRVGR
jgi:hypothetical protein